MTQEQATEAANRIMAAIRNALIAGHSLTEQEMKDIESDEKAFFDPVKEEWIDYLIKIN